MVLLFIIALAWLTFPMQPLYRLKKHIFVTFSTTMHLLTNGTASNCKIPHVHRQGLWQKVRFFSESTTKLLYLPRTGLFSTCKMFSIYTENKFAGFHWYLRDKYLAPLPSGVIAGIPPLQPFCITSTYWYIALSAPHRVQIISS